MKVNAYTASVPVFVRMLTNLSALLDKAAAFAESRKIDPSVLLSARLFPDMFPLARQVQLASDFAKGATSRLAGQEPPAWEDNEASFADLQARLRRTVDFVQGFKPEQFEGADEREVTLKVRGETVKLEGAPYLLQRAMPNFYFHVTTAYAILRHNGVEIGKRDFIGPA
ncbi:MAG: DUF1993 domain-containing protein [Gemmatimonadota bacterium]